MNLEKITVPGIKRNRTEYWKEVLRQVDECASERASGTAQQNIYIYHKEGKSNEPNEDSFFSTGRAEVSLVKYLHDENDRIWVSQMHKKFFSKSGNSKNEQEKEISATLDALENVFSILELISYYSSYREPEKINSSQGVIGESNKKNWGDAACMLKKILSQQGGKKKITLYGIPLLKIAEIETEKLDTICNYWKLKRELSNGTALIRELAQALPDKHDENTFAKGGNKSKDKLNGKDKKNSDASAKETHQPYPTPFLIRNWEIPNWGKHVIFETSNNTVNLEKMITLNNFLKCTEKAISLLQKREEIALEQTRLTVYNLALLRKGAALSSGLQDDDFDSLNEEFTPTEGLMDALYKYK